MLLLDLSGSHLFGTRGKFKRELLAEIAGMLAFLAIRTNDKVGAILFSSQVEKYIPPKKGAAHVWRLIKEIFTYEPQQLTTNIDAVLSYLNRVVKRQAIVFLISDCMDSGFDRSIRLTSKKHDLTVIRISDPAETKLPDVGLVTMQDPETGQVSLINPRSKSLRERWRNFHEQHTVQLNELFQKAGIDVEDVYTDRSAVDPLTRLFERRRRRIK